MSTALLHRVRADARRAGRGERGASGDLLADSDPAAAEAAYREAMALARAAGARAYELRSATGLARVLFALGRDDEARAMLEPVQTRFAEGHDTPDVRTARALLARP